MTSDLSSTLEVCIQTRRALQINVCLLTYLLLLQPFCSPWTLSGTTRVSRCQNGKTSLDLLERDSEWQWHQLGHMQICILLQTDNHASIPPLSFLQARCPSCHPTNSIKALRATNLTYAKWYITAMLLAVVIF